MIGSIRKFFSEVGLELIDARVTNAVGQQKAA